MTFANPLSTALTASALHRGHERLGSTRDAEGRGRPVVTLGKWRGRPRGRRPASFWKRARRRSREMPTGVRRRREQSRAETLWTHSAHSFPCAGKRADLLWADHGTTFRPENMDRTPRSVRADRQAVDRCSAHPTLVMLGFQADIGEGSFDGRPEQQSSNSHRTNSVLPRRCWSLQRRASFWVRRAAGATLQGGESQRSLDRPKNAHTAVARSEHVPCWTLRLARVVSGKVSGLPGDRRRSSRSGVEDTIGPVDVYHRRAFFVPCQTSPTTN